MRPQPDFIREFVPGASNQTLLLLHGTGGYERDLIPLGGGLNLSSVRVPNELLPEKLQARESPNDRRKISESVIEGPFRAK